MASPTFASVSGNAVQAYVTITITNSQSSATPSPFQQKITVDSDTYSSYLASNLSNVNFQDGNGNILNSWLESGNTNTSTSTVYWVSLPNGIAANSSITIYYCIYATSVNAFNNTNTGVAPQLTSTYAQYDNGASVFNFYNNFAGTTLSSLISTPSAITATQNNGLQLAMTSGGTLYTMINQQETAPFIFESLVTAQNAGGGSNFQEGLVIDSSTNVGQNTGDFPGGTNYMFRVGNYSNYFQIFDGASQIAGENISSITYPYTSIESFQQSTTGLVAIDNGNELSVSTTALTSGYLGFYTYGGSGNTQFIQYVRTRAYPPSGTMPSTSFGSLIQTTISVTITYSTEAETYTMPIQVNTPFQYSEAETYTMPTQIATPFQYSEAETYTMPTQIATPFQYSEAETEAQIGTTISIYITYSQAVFASVGSNSVQYYVAITITNSQSSATPAPFQQMITINSSNYSSYLASNLSNVNFQDGNGNILNSWLESGNSNTSTSTVYWVSLPNGIAANSSITIYYCIYATSVNAFNNTNTGVAPQLTSTYGQYDDGANVFNFYDDFAGTTLSSKWSTAGNAATVTVNNGLTLSGSSSAAAGIVTASTISFPVVIETYNEVTTQTTNSFMIAINSVENIAQQSGDIYWQFFDYDYRGSSTYESDYYWNGSAWSTITQGTYVYSTTSYYVTSAIVGNSSYNGYLNYTTSVLSTTSTIPSGNRYIALLTSAANNYVYWFRTRAYPPSGAMPSTSTTSLISVSTIDLAEAETYTIPTQVNTPFQYSEAETEAQIVTTLTAGSLSIPITYSTEAETYIMPTQIDTPFQYTEAETYTIPTQLNTPFQYSEAETYTMPIQIDTPFQYSEAETYTASPYLNIPPISYSQTENYTEEAQADITIYYSEAETYTMPIQIDTPFQYSEAETYTLSPYINTQISYSQTENYVMEALADVTFHYSENETYAISLVYGVPPIIYNEQDSYFLMQNNQTSDASGNLINNIYLNIPFSQNSYISSIPISAYATYLPYKTNVQQVSTSMSSTIPFSFSYSLTTSANTSTYVITATVTDSAGTPIPGVVVNWSASGGTVSPTTSTTNSSGQATTTASGANVTVTAST
ncbi:MAG: DUF2341 domain-containing protein, partial [Candidatus Micrarchaeaceae archaeon]